MISAMTTQDSAPQDNPNDREHFSNQARRVIAKFGGVLRLAELLSEVGHPRSTVSIYRWTYMRSKGGTGGLVPHAMWPHLIRAAHLEGLILNAEDYDPRWIRGPSKWKPEDYGDE